MCYIMWCCHVVIRSIKKSIADLSHKMSELASRPNGGDTQLIDQLSDELMKQHQKHQQLMETKSATCNAV